MKKIAVVFLVLFVFFATFFIFTKENNLIISHSSPDGSYTVSLYQVGSPQWPFGPVKAKLVLKDRNGKKIDKKDFSLFNDGIGVSKHNIKSISWSEDHVEIIMIEDDTAEQYTYILSYTK